MRIFEANKKEINSFILNLQSILLPDDKKDSSKNMLPW